MDETLTAHELAAMLLAGPDLPLVIMGPSSYGTNVTGAEPVTFKEVYEDDTWVEKEVLALDLFDENASSPFSC
jgi:hypothetical protein